MFDSVTISDIPKGAGMIGAYANGRWANYPEARRTFPTETVVSISVNGHHNELAHVLDVERGDSDPVAFVPWATAMADQHVVRPTAYINLGAVGQLMAYQPHGIVPDLWVADWTGEPHSLTIPGAHVVAVQYAAPGHGSWGHFDVSAVYDDTWHPRG